MLCNAPEDRHPDHGRSSKLVSDAAFLAGLRKIDTTLDDEAQKAWRPSYVFHYIQDRYLKPDFVFDISDYHEQKYKLSCVTPPSSIARMQASRKLTFPHQIFLDSVKARALMFGKRIGVKYAEGYISHKMIGVKSFDAFIQEIT